MELVGDCLDKLVVDRHGKKAGRVDGIVLELVEGQPPKVAFIELGPAVMARRFPRWLSAPVRWIVRKTFGEERATARIPAERVKLQRNEVVVDIDANETPGGVSEQWVRTRIITRIPGA
jgi:hypothetical protein